MTTTTEWPVCHSGQDDSKKQCRLEVGPLEAIAKVIPLAVEALGLYIDSKVCIVSQGPKTLEG